MIIPLLLLILSPLLFWLIWYILTDTEYITLVFDRLGMFLKVFTGDIYIYKWFAVTVYGNKIMASFALWS